MVDPSVVDFAIYILILRREEVVFNNLFITDVVLEGEREVELVLERVLHGVDVEGVPGQDQEDGLLLVGEEEGEVVVGEG